MLTSCVNTYINFFIIILEEVDCRLLIPRSDVSSDRLEQETKLNLFIYRDSYDIASSHVII